MVCSICQKIINNDEKFVMETIESEKHFVHQKCLEEVDEIFDDEDDMNVIGKNMFLFIDESIEEY